VTSGSEIQPGDVLVVPASYGVKSLGQATGAKGLGGDRLDLWEAARMAAGQPAAVRLSQAVLAPWLGCPPLKELVTLAASPAPDREAIRDAIGAVLEYRQEEDAPPPPPKWWTDLLAQARDGRMLEHPAGGLVLVARAPRRRGAESDLFADDDDLASAAHREVTLENHSQLVRRAAQKIAERCLPASLSGALALAGLWHDAGKLDPRFQVLLRQGDEVAAAAAAEAIAKSAFVPSSPARRRAIREASGLPRDFRHEMLSLELARRFAELPPDDASADLVLHLITSHHGHGRPFAPVAVDPSLPDVSGTLAGTNIWLASQDRASSPPAYRVDSGVAERFWRLTRRYGWWGLAYLEALLRLADWYASNFSGAEGGGV
jgi:CRISPR-associated endonuclease/helicase Cas3